MRTYVGEVKYENDRVKRTVELPPYRSSARFYAETYADFYSLEFWKCAQARHESVHFLT